MSDTILFGAPWSLGPLWPCHRCNVCGSQMQTDVEQRVLDGQPVPEPGPDKSAGPARAGRGTSLSGKVAVVTGAARGIGRAIAVEMAANGADVIAVGIARPISTASDAVPATPDH